MSHVSLAVLAIAIAAAFGVGANAAPRPSVYSCSKVDCPPVVDGKLDDPAWKIAPEMTLVMSCTGEPATKRTTARMCWDDDCLYIGFDCVDTDILATMTNRDDWIWREEVVEAFICPSCNLTQYYEINLSPLNTLFDAYIVNDGTGPGEGTDFGWNCEGIRTAVCVDGTVQDRTDVDRGWSAEYAIPFAGLKRSTPKPGERWRLNLYRIDLVPEPKEFQAWSPTLTEKPAFHIPERFGTVFFTVGG